MRHPESLASLVEMGLIQEVVRPLMSGKEAQIYLVVSEDELRVAKVYKTAENRSFRQRAEYTEGRVVRNTRTQRAMSRHSRFGRAQEEASWRSAEAEIIYRLRAAGVWVPQPHNFIDGVLVMELITDPSGDPAPRLADVVLDHSDSNTVFAMLLSSVVKMLCAGVVHGDLSEYNVLLGQEGPVLIDFPQAVDPAHNRNARKLLIRDVDNLHQLLVRGPRGRRRLPYGQEMWELYERGELTPETPLTGRYRPARKKANTSMVLREVEVAARDAQQRRESQAPARGRRRRKSRRGRQDQPVEAAQDASAQGAQAKGTQAPSVQTKRASSRGAQAKGAQAKRASAKRAQVKEAQAKRASAKRAQVKDAQSKRAMAKGAQAKGAQSKRASVKGRSAAPVSASMPSTGTETKPPGKRRRRRRRRRNPER